MTGIKAYAEIMREQIGQIDEESQKKYLNIILQQMGLRLLSKTQLLQPHRAKL